MKHADIWRERWKAQLEDVRRDSVRLAKIVTIMEREEDVRDLETDVEAAKGMASDVLQRLSEIGGSE